MLAAARQREREAFEHGRETGRAEGAAGLEARLAERDRQMAARRRDLMRSPLYAELERRRYGQGGRPSWVIRRPGETPGAGTQLEPGDGQWPRDLRRRARRAGQPDPFHIRWGPGMTCTACAWWGLPCPADDWDEEVADDWAGNG